MLATFCSGSGPPAFTKLAGSSGSPAPEAPGWGVANAWPAGLLNRTALELRTELASLRNEHSQRLLSAVGRLVSVRENGSNFMSRAKRAWFTIPPLPLHSRHQVARSQCRPSVRHEHYQRPSLIPAAAP